MKKYIVYGLINPLDNKLFYIGKGRENRPYQHMKEIRRGEFSNPFKTKILLELLENDCEPIINIYYETFVEDDALKKEAILIEKYGKIQNGGILTNMLDSGFKQSGYIVLDETREKISKGLKNKYKDDSTFKEKTINKLLIFMKDNPEKVLDRNKHISEARLKSEKVKKYSNSLKGTKRSREIIEKISNSKKGHFVSNETKKKISEKLKGRKLSEETKKKISDNVKGRTDEWREKISESRKGTKVTNETKMKLSNSMKESSQFKTSIEIRNEKYSLLKQYGIPTRKNVKAFVYLKNGLKEFHSSKEFFGKKYKTSIATIDKCLDGLSDKFNLRFLNNIEINNQKYIRNQIMNGLLTTFDLSLLTK